MKIEFTKMHGCGNDYVYIDGARHTVPDEIKPDVVQRLSDRHTGIGSDGVIFINPSDIADFEMEMYNADGSRSEMCGNGIRCVAKYVYDKGLMDRDLSTVDIESFGKVKHIELSTESGEVTLAKVDMGQPVLRPELIPVNMDGYHKSDTGVISAFSSLKSILPEGTEDVVIDYPIKAAGGEYRITCVSMGNPHAVVYVDDTAGLEIEKIGPVLETHVFFPKRANIEFVQNVDREHVRMRVWERGTGETMACGTGCCALTVAGVLNGYYDIDTDVHISVLGGEIIVRYASDGHVYMTGPATTVFEGTVEV